MTTHGTSSSIPGHLRLGQSILGLFWTSPRHHAAPPIFLLKKNQVSRPSATKLLLDEPVGTTDVPLTHVLALPVIAGQIPSRIPLNGSGLLSRAWSWIRARQKAGFSTRRLRVTETVSLGEKRFVAVIQIDGLQFLIGGGATNVAMLAQLNAKGTFGELLAATMTIPKTQIDDPTAGQTREQT